MSKRVAGCVRKGYLAGSCLRLLLDPMQELGSVPESEWDEYLAAIRRRLPTTFRVTGTRRCVCVAIIIARKLAHIIWRLLVRGTDDCVCGSLQRTEIDSQD